MFGKLFELLDRWVCKRLGIPNSMRDDNGKCNYRQLSIDWHTLEAAGVDQDN